ncbi:Protein MIZU-KUSSEI like [Actinidia chinensis var. chinensis]|uniref:Protein MIZU-KUSSEI like n=1 Tax=Actinidia chinensis var. chinensis TaxID=1590841 RepID=A0A2R6PRW2_ACTCC|nr:Protein MIZU-KUSSEI like [Actinidia chinensis var. chinensis]
MAKSSEDVCSKRHFHWTNKVSNKDEEEEDPTLKPPSSNTSHGEEKMEKDKVQPPLETAASKAVAQRRKLQAFAVSKVRSVIAAFSKNWTHSSGLGPQVIGTLFGHRRGHVHFALQKEPNSPPAFLIELATPISGLVREMASGLVRIALECDKDKEEKKAAVAGRRQLLEEPQWRTYCNGKKCGFAARRGCGPKEWKILKAVEPISMGAGVLPGDGSGSGSDKEGEVMYMRAKFERVVGCRDSEAFYMMNPDRNGAPELSIYLLRV